MKAQVNIINADRAKRSVAALAKRLQGHDKVLVGVQKGSGTYDDGTPIAVIAAANHFGANLPGGAKIPARAYLDVAVANNAKRYSTIAKHQIPKVLDGKMDMDQVLNQIGEAASGDVKIYITELRDPPNAASTIKKKGSDNPLIDTGNLRASIRHEIAREPVEEGL